MNLFKKHSSKNSLKSRAKEASKNRNWDLAAKLWEKVLNDFPNNVNALNELGKCYMNAGEFSAAENHFTTLRDNFPSLPKGYVGLARIAIKQNEFEGAINYLEQALEINPNDRTLLLIKACTLVEMSHLDDACAILNFLKDENFRLYDTYKQLAKIAEWNLDWRKFKEYYLKLIELNNSKFQDSGYDIHVIKDLIELNLKLDNNEESLRLARAIPSTFSNHPVYQIVKAWQCACVGDYKKAQSYDATKLNSNFSKAIEPHAGKLKNLTDKRGSIKRGATVLVTRLYNEMFSISSWLEYYRKIGVDEFVIVDNDSNDGTTDYLLEQSDVTLYHTKRSYRDAQGGMQWMNGIISQKLPDHWCIFADADEFLITPKIESRGLSNVLDFMEENGDLAMQGFMLDMHGEKYDTALKGYTGKDLLRQYPYFNNSYLINDSIEAPYKEIRGGIIAKVFQQQDRLVKTPIIRTGNGIKYLSSSHVITPAKISKMTGLFLHFKLTENFKPKIQEVLDRKQHFNAGEKYIQYDHRINSIQGVAGFFDENTIRYKDSNQLVTLGLISDPAHD